MILSQENGNSSEKPEASQTSIRDFTTIQNIQLVCYVIIFITGVIGNVLVCLVVCRERRMRTVTNYFIVNLSAADLLVLCICIPFDFGEKISETWPYGGFLCRVIYPLQTMMTTASVGSLVAISLNRYHAVVYPLRPQLTTTHAKWIVLIIWLLSLILVSPYMSALHIRNGLCEEDWGKLSSKAYTLVIFLAQYVLPLTVIGLAYTRIGKDLKRKSKKYSYNDVLHREQERDSHRVVKMLLIVVITFSILMFPLHVLFIWSEFGDEFEHFWEIVAFCQILIYANSATNPIIYSACNENFRDGFKSYFKSAITCITSSREKLSKESKPGLQNKNIADNKLLNLYGNSPEVKASGKLANDNGNTSSPGLTKHSDPNHTILNNTKKLMNCKHNDPNMCLNKTESNIITTL